MPHVVRFASRLVAVLLLACASLFCAPAAFAVDSGDIVVVSTKGEVHITMNGAERSVRAGGVLELPASVRTGRDGNIELRQGATTVSVGPETLLEFPALEKRGAPIDRILQPRGNAFYNIGKREGRKLRVETPYLVGVIKGTQFNVASQDGSTTISLFEGLLEVRASDDSAVIDLKAGEIASRRHGEKSISVLKMDAGKVPPTSSRPSPGGGSNDAPPDPAAPRAAPSPEGGDSLLADRGPTSVPASVDLDTNVRTGGPAAVEVGVAPAVSPGQGVDASTNIGLNASSTGVDVGADTGVSVGNSVDATANVAVNVGPSGADVVTTVGVDVGPAAVDAGVAAAVDVAAGAVDVNAGTTVDAGPVTVELGANTSVDLAAGTIDTSTSTGVDAGPLTTDLTTDTAVDVASGAVNANVIVGASAPGVEIDVGAAAAVDAVTGTANLGLDVLGTDIGVSVDVPATVDTVETVTTPVTDTVVDVGGLLDGLIRRPGRK